MILDFKLQVVIETRDVLIFHIIRSLTVSNTMAVNILSIRRRHGMWNSERIDKDRKNKM